MKKLPTDTINRTLRDRMGKIQINVRGHIIGSGHFIIRSMITSHPQMNRFVTIGEVVLMVNGERKVHRYETNRI